MSHNRADIAPITPLLQKLNLPATSLLGWGGEAWVFALDAHRVVRIGRSLTSAAWADGRIALLNELAAGAAHLPFAIPHVLDHHIVDGFQVTTERRLPGRPLLHLLSETTGERRDALIRAYLDAADQIGDLPISRPWFGELAQHQSPIRTPTFRGYLAERARRSLHAAGPIFAHIDPDQLAAALPEAAAPALIHLDAFAGNMMAAGERITAVLDFGYATIIGDRRFNPLVAAIYLDNAITPPATDRDRALADSWLAAHDLLPLLPAARRWLAAYWAFAHDDPELFVWCQRILLGDGSRRRRRQV